MTTSPPAAQGRDGGATRAAPSATTINVLVALLCVLWGSTWLVIKIGLGDMGPFTGAGLRFLVAAVVMSAVAPALARREGGDPPPWWLSATMGLLNLTLSYGIVYWCETRLASGLVSILWGVFPLMVAFGGHFFLRSERLVTRQWLGFAVGFSGVFVLFAYDVHGVGWDAVPVGLVLLLSPLACAAATMVIKRHGAGVSSALLNRNALWIAAPLMLGFAGPGDGWAVAWTTRTILSVLYLAIAGTALTFGIYFWLMRYAAANRLSLIAYVTPPIAITLGWSILDEPILPSTLGGSALILAGIVLVVRRPRGRVVADRVRPAA
jgi:drug/metabolite transporter (DMT)-like permease